MSDQHQASTRGKSDRDNESNPQRKIFSQAIRFSTLSMACEQREQHCSQCDPKHSEWKLIQPLAQVESRRSPGMERERGRSRQRHEWCCSFCRCKSPGNKAVQHGVQLRDRQADHHRQHLSSHSFDRIGCGPPVGSISKATFPDDREQKRKLQAARHQNTDRCRPDLVNGIIPPRRYHPPESPQPDNIQNDGDQGWPDKMAESIQHGSQLCCQADQDHIRQEQHGQMTEKLRLSGQVHQSCQQGQGNFCHENKGTQSDG